MQQNRPQAVMAKAAAAAGPTSPKQVQQQLLQLQQQLQQSQNPAATASSSTTQQPHQQIYKKSNAISMTEAVSLPLGVPAFRRIPAVDDTNMAANSVDPQSTFANRKVMYQYPTQVG